MNEFVPVFESSHLWTEIGIISYPSLDKPKKATLAGQKDKFETNLILDSSACNALYAEVIRIAVAAFGPTAVEQMKAGGKLSNPFKNGNTQERKAANGQKEPDPIYQGKYFLSLRNKNCPFLKGASGTDDVLPSKFYSGCKARAYVSIFAFPKPGKQIPNKGVSLGLEILQFAGDGERIGGGGPMSADQAAKVMGAIPGSAAPSPFGDVTVQPAGLPPLG